LVQFVREEFKACLRCGRLDHGFIWAKCTGCRHEYQVAFSAIAPASMRSSCKRRGWCPSCASRRMAESGARLVDNVLPKAPYRQWVLSFPWPLRMLFAARPQWLSPYGLGGCSVLSPGRYRVRCSSVRACATATGRAPGW
jgi:hypothetical protein